jgi:hypothetical protein
MSENPMPPSALTFKSLVDKIDSILNDEAHSKDTRSTALIALALGDLIASRLDDMQREALDTARVYWQQGGNDKQRLEFIETIGTRRDKDVRDGTMRSSAGYANQIVWTALNANTGLSGFAGEFLVEIGTGAGLSPSQIESAFCKGLPAFLRRG